MARVARIDVGSGLVLNVETWDDPPPKTDGVLFIASDTAGLGDVYDPKPGTFSRPASPAPIAPDGPSLRLWRTGLKFWKNADGTTRFAAVDAAITALEKSPNAASAVMGEVAREAFEFANTVDRETLHGMMAAFNFTSADVEESLWRANRIGQGDYSGVWPLPQS